MAVPLWRKWFKRTSHAVSFAMRDFFVFIGILVNKFLKSKISKKLFRFLDLVLVKIDFKNRSRRIIILSSLVLIISTSIVIFFATTAKAEKEVHAYVSASLVSGEGVDNPIGAQLQDLSVDARFSDFTTDLTARVAFGSYVQTVKESVDSENNSNQNSSSTPDLNLSTTTSEIISSPTSTEVIVNNNSAPVSFLKNKYNYFSKNISVFGYKSLSKIFGLKTVIAQEAGIASPSDAVSSDVSNTEVASPSTNEVTPTETITSPSDSNSVSSTSAESITSSEPKDFVKEDRDPFKVASCTTFSKTCHLITLEGFGVGGEISKYPVKDARLMLSLAGKAAPSETPDRIIVRAYKNERWDYLGEQVVKGEFDNAMRGGYVSLPLSLDSWSDLAGMIVSVEYVREGESDSVMLLDSAWVDVTFEANESPEDLALYSPNVKSALLARDAERRARERDHLDLQNGLSIDFKNTMQGLSGAKLRVATTKEKQTVLGSGEDYVAVTNFSDSAERVHLSFYFPEEGGRVTDIAKYTHNSPYKVVESKSSPIAYFCEKGWNLSTTTEDVLTNKTYVCADNNEPHLCSSISDDNTSCLSEVTSIGKEETTVYRRFFEPDSVFSGSFSEKQSILGKVIDSIFNDIPSNTIPASEKEVSYSNSFDVEPGATKYFRVAFDTPLNTRGDIYVKAESESGAYGLVKTEFDGSWNWKIPVDIGLPYRASDGEVAVPVSLDKMPLSFWEHVNDNGSDIRFSDEDGLIELPSWVSEFNKNKRKGFVWVRLPRGAGVMPRVFLYAGNESSDPVYKSYLPFTTSELTDRAVVVSNGVEDPSVQITSLSPSTRVSVGDGPERTLLYGEVALFENVKGSSLIKSTGPISVRTNSVFGRATAAPLGTAGLSVGIPEDTLELGVTTAQREVGETTIGESVNELASNTVFRTPISGEIHATSSVPSIFVADTQTDSIILGDKNRDERLNLSSSVVLDKKAVGVRATCDNGRDYGVYDDRGSLIATSTCNKVIDGPFPEGTMLSVFYGATSTPFSAVFSAIYNGDEKNIIGSDSNSRSVAGYDPEIAFGEPEYVIPGEHRIFDSEFSKDKPHITRFLSKKREFSAEEVPTFRFQYKPQSNSFFRTLRSFFGIAPFSVEEVIVEQAGQPVDIKTSVEYSGNLEWAVKFDKIDSQKIAPGKLTLKMVIKEGTSRYEDSYDFYWGLLSMNFNKAVYEKGETAEISLGALSESGNTICNAKLKLFVTDSASSTREIDVTPSGKCDGNNITDVPDYTAQFVPVDLGVYNLRLVRLDEQENILAEVRDSFNVVSHQSYIIERKGPTRINPTAPYEMTLRVVSREGYKGELTEKIPADFEVVNRGGSTLKWADDSHVQKLAVWDVDMKPGEVYQFTYSFDAPDKSPFIYFLGPATIGDGDSAYTENRRWMIASDVAGKMIIFWANGMTPPPIANWACVSCGGGADNSLVGRWTMGSSTYGLFGGTSTHLPSVTASVGSSIGATGLVGAGGANLVYKDHTHTFTPTITVGDHKPPSLSLMAYKNLNAGEQTVPAGAILYYASSTAPAGWTAVSSMDGYYPYGGNSVGTATGTATHTHTVSGTTGVIVGGASYVSGAQGTAVSNSAHTHIVNATTTNAVTNNPPYVTYRMISADSAGAIPNETISMWDADPAPGWINLSGPGGVLENKFIKAGTAVGSTGGSATHFHADQLGVATAAAVGTTKVPNGAAGAFGSAATHTHTVDYTSYTETTSLPPYVTVVFAKRSVGISEFAQEGFRFYDNVNDQLPVDPWPANEIDISENTSIEDVGYRIRPGNTFRVRMSASISNATSSIGLNKFKLQYSTDGACSSALNWNDVGAPGSAAPLRGYDNNLVTDGATLNNKLLSSSTLSALQYYSESSSQFNFVRQAGLGTIAEFDWVLNANSSLASSSRYCLRMIENGGKVFGQYKNYPSFLTNSSPNTPSLITQFDNAKLMTLTPTLSFTASDEESNAMHYAIEIDDDPNFGSPNVAQSTTNASANFSNLTNPSNKAPYSNGDMVQYSVQSAALSNNTTYWWRVKAMDPVGSTQYGAWSTPKSFTTDTTLTTSAWFQTTDAQFSNNNEDGLTVSSNSVKLTVGSTTGVMFSPEVIFNEGPFGSVWGALSFNDDGGSGITYQVEYKDAGGNWNLVPNSVLANNSTGFGASPIALTTIDPLYYPSLRLRANFTNSGTPSLNDWTITWAYKTLAPILSTQFNNAKLSTTTPTLSFAAVDPLGRTIAYEVQYSTDPTFAASTTCNSGGACSAGFKNLTNAGNVSPFNSSDSIQFKFQTALTNGTTYFWRSRAYGTGGGAWSFWSETRSFTIDTSATLYPTWFQTMKGQWSLDTLSGVYSNTGNSVAVATSSDKVLIAYGKGSDNKPKYRFYEAGTIGTEADMLSVDSTVLWSTARASLANDQFIVGTMGSNRSVKMQVFEDGIWSRMFTFPQTGPSAQRKSFSVNYESKSGHAMAISCDGKNADYAIFDGSTWGTVQSLTLGFANNCELVKMASNPIKNELIAVFRDTGPTYHVEVWDGSSWSATNRFDFNTANAGMTEPAHDGMAVEYEGSSGRALVVVSHKAVRGFVYRMWNGTTWGTETVSANLGNNTSAQFEWGYLKKDPASNNLMLCAISQYSDIDDGAFTDYTRWNAATSAFVAGKLGQYYPYTRHGQSMDCEYETKAGRTGKMVTVSDESWNIADGSTTNNRTVWDSLTVATNVWQSGVADINRRWNAVGTTYNWNATETWTDKMEKASQSGDVLNIGLARNTLNYIFSVWNGATWTTPTAIGASSVGTKPFGQPFDMIGQDGFNQGRVFSQPINFSDGNAPSWREIRFTTTKPVSTNVLVSVEYLDGSDWIRIPDSQIVGNSLGTTTSPINLRNVNSQLYNKIRLRADLTCNGLASCPTLDDWTLEWTEGLTVSGIAREADRTTPLTSGTVKVAVNGVEQIGKTGTIGAGGVWSITGVNYKVGEAVTAWIDNPGVGNRAAAVVKYAGAGNLANVELSRKWLTIGDSGQPGSTIENSEIGIFDNNNEAGTTRADLFFNVDATDNLALCNTGNCSDFSLSVATGTTWRPNSAAASINTMYSININGVVAADANTIKVGGNWINTGSFSSGNSNVIFNATSSTKTINNGGAALYKFNNVTFGEAATPAIWQLASPLYVNGNLKIDYGTLSPLAQPINIEKNLDITASGIFTKGTATTTFSGASIASWSDLTAAGQDMGIVTVDGSPKQLSLSSSGKATALSIATGDTFSFGVNTLTLLGNFVNNGIVLPGSGKLTMSPAAAATIKQNGYALNNITISSGNVSWVDTNATSTGDVLISGGTTVFPTASLFVAGSLNQTAGTFTAPSSLIMNASTPGKQIVPISNLSNVSFIGTGAWTFGANATSTGNITMTAGTVTMPSGTLTVSGNFVNNGANINNNSGVLRLNGTTQNITLGGSFLSGITSGTGSNVSFTEANATTTGSIISETGSTFNFPTSGSITVGGSVINNGTMNANASTLYMNRASGAATVSAGAMVLSNTVINGAGTFTILGNTRISASLTIGNVGGFVMENTRQLQVDGFFTNGALNANTTWTGSTLRLTSGATMSANSKASGGDTYNIIILDGATQLRLWNSSATTVTTNATSSLYAQNWAGVNGALRIYGTYAQNNGVAYWDYAKDFDGTAFTPGSERQVNVTIGSGATLNFATTSAVELIGISSLKTTVTSLGAFAFNMASSTLTSNFSSIRGMNVNGINMSGSSTIAALDDTDFIIDTNNGYAMTLSRDVIDSNKSKQFYRDSFVKGAVATAYNIKANAPVTTNYIRFKQHTGDTAGEAKSTDPGGNPGEIRWDDSNYLINISGTVYSDAGTTLMDSSVCDSVTPVVNVKVTGGGIFSAPCMGDGTFTVSNVSFTGEKVMSIYLSGTTANGVVVTRGASTDLSGIKIYQDRIILRHEDVLPMTIAALSGFDADDDPDMLFTANAGTLNIPSSYEFWVWTGKTFQPGGNVVTGAGGPQIYSGAFHLDNAATYDAQGTEQITIGGRFQSDTGAVFNTASTTILFNPTDIRTITSVSALSVNNIRFTGTGTSTISAAVTVKGTFDLSSGGINGAGSITANSDATGNGNLAMTGGTFTVKNGGLFGGANPWLVYNLTFGDGATIATTTKNGVGTTTVKGVMTVKAVHHYNMNAAPLVLSGPNNVLSVLGSINTNNTIITYSPTANANVANIKYSTLQFLGNGTSTLPTMNLLITGDLIIGNNSTSTKVDANTNDPSITVGGNVIIKSLAKFTASDAGGMFVSGSWTNSGTFINSAGTINFVGSGNKTVTSGGSPFSSVKFIDSNGSWTIAENATATSMYIGSSTSWTLASGKTLEITGNFQNQVGGANTTWTGSTLYLNTGVRDDVNPKTVSGDIYETLRVGAGTEAILWNSSSTQFITAAGSGVLSQNHAGVNGDLYIYGDYIKTTGSEYWSYLTDFDGEILDAGHIRQAKIKFAPGSTATYNGTSNLEIIGKNTASTTIRSLSGTYGLSIGGATTTMQYVDFSNMDSNGVQFTGTVKVAQMDDVSYSNPLGTGTMMTVAGSVITANPLRTTYNNSFNATGGNNIKVTGTTASAWRIRNHYGNRAGEAYDVDPMGDPGYIIWDDSAAQIYITGKILKSDGVTVSSICNGITQNVFLKVQGAGTLTSACSAADGSYSIGPVVYAPFDTLAVYTTTGSVAYAYRPMTNISDMDLYENTVIVRNEQAESITNTGINSFDKDNNAALLGRVTGTNLVLDANTKLIIWNNKSYAPGGNVSVGGNTNISSVDGDAEIRAGAEWVTSGVEQYTIGGDFSMGNNARVTGGLGEFIFTSSVSGKTISASTPATMTNLTFNNSGTWTITGVATTTGNVKIQNGNVTLPNTSFAIGGDFNNQSTFNANGGLLSFTSNAAGKQIRSNGNNFGSITFLGTGSWSFLDSATTTGNFTIASGTPTLPSGVLSVNGDFENIAGSFVSNSGSIIVRGTGSRKIVPGGSTFNNLRIENGTYSTNMMNATTTGDVVIASGSLNLPVAQFAVGGTFRNTGTFSAGATSTVKMTANATGKIINAGASEFNNLIIDGVGGGFTVEANTVVNGQFAVKNASAFVQSPTTKLTVKDLFTNNIGGTWTGSTLRLEKSGTSTINIKTNTGAAYNALELGLNTQISSWKSSYSTVTPDAGASLYSQDDNNTSGSLRIYGSYVKSGGGDYWSTTRDFDGAVISSRTATVRFANGASATYSNGATLEAVGEVGKITSIQSISGNYSLEVNNGVFKGNYFKVRNTSLAGFKLSGNTSIQMFDNADLATGVDTGSIITMDATVVDQNTGSVFSNDSFALDSGHTSGTNIFLNGSTNNSITLTSHSGGLDGEAFDNDGASACGAFRWDDSSCQFIDQRYFRWRNDNGGEAVPDNEWLGGSASGWTYRERVHVVNSSTVGNTDVAVKVVLPYQPQMRSDFADIRFTSNDGVTQIPHWLEKYSSASNATVWVKVPQILAKSSSDVFVYYGNAGAPTVSNGPNTFTYIFDANSGLTGMGGDTSSFITSSGPTPIPPYNTNTGPNYLRANDMASFANGMANSSAGVNRGTTIREKIYINGSENDDTCLTFGVGATISNNWGFCVSPLQSSKNIRLVKDARKDGFAPNISSEISTTDITLSTAGWYTARIDWETTGNITAKLYDPSDNLVATLNASDGYNPGSGIGFTYWYQHGAWENIIATPYLPGDPTVLVLTPQQHGGATWKMAENTSYMTALQNEILRVRFGIRNTGTALYDQQLRLDYAVKGAYPNCESVPDGNYSYVKPASTCGTADICMATSTYFADNDATTPLLSTPKGLSFVQGRMVESPSNSTPGYNLPANTYTEVEYAMRFTPSAMQPSYCMRVSNNGTRLVSYTKVAEAAILQPPIISNWNFASTPIYLNEGTTTRIVATGTVMDFNGANDMVSATGTMYRSGVAGGASCSQNSDNCYSSASTSCSLSGCAGFSCNVTCSTDVQYYADRTDYGTYAAEDWKMDVTVKDTQGLVDREIANSELIELKALALDTPSINYGDIEVGSSTAAGTNPKVTLQNTGNSSYSLMLEGSDLTATGSLIPVNDQVFSTSTSFSVGSCTLCQPLSVTPQAFGLTLPKPNSSQPVVTDFLYWGIQVPYGTKAMTHNGSVSISAN